MNRHRCCVRVIERNASASARSAGGVRLAATDDGIEGTVDSIDSAAAARSAAAAATADAPLGGVSSYERLMWRRSLRLLIDTSARNCRLHARACVPGGSKKCETQMIPSGK